MDKTTVNGHFLTSPDQGGDLSIANQAKGQISPLTSVHECGAIMNRFVHQPIGRQKMAVEVMTFLAEPEFMAALRLYAEKSAN